MDEVLAEIASVEAKYIFIVDGHLAGNRRKARLVLTTIDGRLDEPVTGSGSP